MRYEAINPGAPLTPHLIDAYCRQHDLRLPDPLREQLLDQNGGSFRDDMYVRVGAEGREKEVDGLLGIDMFDHAVELWWVIETFKGRLPPGCVPFADDPGGNLFLLDAHGRVLFWDHEREGAPDAAELVASSLLGFLNELRTE